MKYKLLVLVFTTICVRNFYCKTNWTRHYHKWTYVVM